MIRAAERLFHTSDSYDGDKLFTVRDGRRLFTPMLLVMVAIGGTDILFALDSIRRSSADPERVHRLHRDRVQPARAAAAVLPGRRTARPPGVPVVRAGRDPRLHRRPADPARPAREQPAVRQQRRPGARGGAQHRMSLGVILAVLVVTVSLSVFSSRGKARTAIKNARRHATEYLDSEYTADPAERERIFHCLLDEKQQISELGPKYRQLVEDEPELMGLLERARTATRRRSPPARPARAPGGIPT
jgi:tellurite resistance protein TerC